MNFAKSAWIDFLENKVICPKSGRIDFLDNNLIVLKSLLSLGKIVRKEDLAADTNDCYYAKSNEGPVPLRGGQDFYNSIKQVSAQCQFWTLF